MSIKVDGGATAEFMVLSDIYQAPGETKVIADKTNATMGLNNHYQ